MSQALLETSLDRVLSWSKSRDYAGYSKFDAFNSPVVKALTLGSPWLRMVASPLWARQPVNLRPWLATTQSRNPKGIALFALAYLRRYAQTGKKEDLAEARELLSWLNRNACQGFSGKCWGYDHDWQNLFFYAPKYTPNIVVSGNVAYAFLEAYEITGEIDFLHTARSTAEFMMRDLLAPVDTPEMRSIGYVPGSRWGVLNINGLASATLARVWKHTGEEPLIREASRLIAFLADKQTDYGAWHYAWPAKTSNVKHDSYHTGNVLDWILDYSLLSGDSRYLPVYEKGLDFFVKHLFTEDGAAKWRSDRAYPLDAHGAAQAVVTLCKAAGDLSPQYLDLARRSAAWAVTHLQAPEGFFHYQQGRFFTKKYTLMRWCNAWMAYALASLLLTEHRLETRPCAA